MGKDTIKESYKKDKKRFFLFILFICMVFYSGFATKRLISVSKQHVEFKKEMESKGYIKPDSKIVSTTIKKETAKVTELPTAPSVRLNSPSGTTVPTNSAVYDRRGELINYFEEMDGE